LQHHEIAREFSQIQGVAIRRFLQVRFSSNAIAQPDGRRLATQSLARIWSAAKPGSGRGNCPACRPTAANRQWQNC